MTTEHNRHDNNKNTTNITLLQFRKVTICQLVLISYSGVMCSIGILIQLTRIESNFKYYATYTIMGCQILLMLATCCMCIKVYTESEPKIIQEV